jgi:hypothetical protein
MQAGFYCNPTKNRDFLILMSLPLRPRSLALLPKLRLRTPRTIISCIAYGPWPGPVLRSRRLLFDAKHTPTFGSSTGGQSTDPPDHGPYAMRSLTALENTRGNQARPKKRSRSDSQEQGVKGKKDAARMRYPRLKNRHNASIIGRKKPFQSCPERNQTIFPQGGSHSCRSRA